MQGNVAFINTADVGAEYDFMDVGRALGRMWTEATDADKAVSVFFDHFFECILNGCVCTAVPSIGGG